MALAKGQKPDEYYVDENGNKIPLFSSLYLGVGAQAADSDKLEGQHAAVAAGNNTIVQRHGSGYVFANYFNTTPNNVGAVTPTAVCVETGNDGYIRHQTMANFKTALALGIFPLPGDLLLTASNKKASPPTGYLYCNGASLLRASYAALFTAIGTTHGTVDGTHFNIPDYRGRFLRAQADGQARDPDRATRTAMNPGGNTGDNIGSVQLDAFQGHKHSAEAAIWTHQAGIYPVTGGVTAYGMQNTTNPIGVPSTDGSNGTPRTTSETRPVNANIQAFIKY